MGEAILLLRRIPEKNARVHLGHWDKSASGAFETRGKTLGIVGYGNIGSQISTLAEGLGMRVVFHDVEAKLPLGNARAAGSLNELLEQSDVVTLHVPGGKSTENIMNAETIGRMRRGSILINASRGAVVDIDALHQALKSGHLAGAALDVFPTEPKGPDEPLDSPLIGLPNVILTPHIGGSTQESQENIGREVAEKLVRFLQAGTTKGAVNFPELPYLERRGHAHPARAPHAPGALGTLDNLMAQHGLNIVSQTLQTKGQIGYVITDVEGQVDDLVMSTLRQHPSRSAATGCSPRQLPQAPHPGRFFLGGRDQVRRRPPAGIRRSCRACCRVRTATARSGRSRAGTRPRPAAADAGPSCPGGANLTTAPRPGRVAPCWRWPRSRPAPRPRARGCGASSGTDPPRAAEGARS